MRQFIIGGLIAAGVALGTGTAQADDPTPTPAPAPPGDWSSMMQQAQDDYNNSPCGMSLATYPGGSFPHLQFKPCPAPAAP